MKFATFLQTFAASMTWTLPGSSFSTSMRILSLAKSKGVQPAAVMNAEPGASVGLGAVRHGLVGVREGLCAVGDLGLVLRVRLRQDLDELRLVDVDVGAGRGHDLDVVQRKDAADERSIELEVHAREAADAGLGHVDVVRAGDERDGVRRRLFLALDDRGLHLQPLDDLRFEGRIAADGGACVRALLEQHALVVVRDDRARLRP